MLNRSVMILALLSIPLHTAENLFDQGCAAHHAKDFKHAYDLFNALDTKDPLVWYNMGSAAYQQDNKVQAIICWERALKQASGQFFKECQYNLTQAKKELGLPLDQSSVRTSTAAVLPTGVWQFLFLIVWYASMLSLVWIKRKSIGAVLLAVCCIFGLPLLTYYQAQQPTAIVKNETSLLVGPDIKFHVVQKVPALAYVAVKDTQKSWYKVQYGRSVGWIPMEGVEVI